MTVPDPSPERETPDQDEPQDYPYPPYGASVVTDQRWIGECARHRVQPREGRPWPWLCNPNPQAKGKAS